MTINELVELAAQNPGATAQDYAELAGRNLRNTQRDLAEAVKRGALVRRMNGKAYGYYVANGGGSYPGQRHTTSCDNRVHAPSLGGMDHGAADRQINGAIDDQPIRLDPRKALVPAGGQVIHRMPDVPASGGRGSARAWPDGLKEFNKGMHSATNGFRAFDDDPAAEGSFAYDQIFAGAANEANVRADRAEAENTRLRQQIAVRPNEPTTTEMLLRAGIAGIGLFANGNQRDSAQPAPKPGKQPVAAEPMIDRFALRREIRAAVRQEFEEEDETEMEEDDIAPEPATKPVKQLLAKPNGHAAPPAEKRMTLSSKWGITAACVAGAALLAKFLGGLSA